MVSPCGIAALALGLAVGVRAQDPASAAESTPPEVAARAARAALLEVATKDRTAAMLHAGEALIAFGEGDKVHALFLGALAELEATPRRGGVWRELAASSPTAGERAQWIARIQRVLVESSGHAQTNALENLCKLREPYTGASLATAQEIARHGSPAEAVFALWALQQAGDPTATERLAAGLMSNDTLVRRLSGYALRWVRPTDPGVRLKLGRAADAEPAGTETAAYLLSAALIVNPSAPRAGAWREKLEEIFASAPGNERYQASFALMPAMTPADLPRLQRMLSHPESDVRVAAAWSILYVQAHRIASP